MNYKNVDDKVADKIVSEDLSEKQTAVGDLHLVAESAFNEPLFPAMAADRVGQSHTQPQCDFLLSVPALADRLDPKTYCDYVSGGLWVAVYRSFLQVLPLILVVLGLSFLASGNPSEVVMKILNETPDRFYYYDGIVNPVVDWKAIIVGSLMLIGVYFAGRAYQEELGSFSSRATRAGLTVIVLSLTGMTLFSGGQYGTFTNLLFIWSLIAFLLALLSTSISGLRFFNKQTTGALSSVVRLGEGGFSFGWLSKSKFFTPEVPWSAVKSIANHTLKLNKKYQGGADPTASAMLVIDVDSTQIDRPDDFLALTRTFASRWKLEDGKLLPLADGVMRLHLPLAAISLESERPAFLEAFRERIDTDLQDESFKELIKDGPRGGTFTRLWLDEANRTRRRNNDELAGGTALQDGLYRIDCKLASGGQATVYRGRIAGDSDKVVAIKEFVLPDGGGVETRNRSVDSIRHEAQLHAVFEHPAIPKILDNFIEDGRAYLVFEFIEGRSLRQIVQEDGRLAADRVLSIGRDLAEILAYLHGLSPPIVHRDLSPDNLMLGSDGRLVLIDFNVAEQLESNATKTVVGKHHYMAPEQFKGKPCPQSDLYSMGGCLYYLATGNDPRPLTQSNLPDLKEQEQNQDIEIDGASPEAVDSGARQRLAEVIRKLTNLSLDGRYGSAEQFLSEPN